MRWSPSIHVPILAILAAALLALFPALIADRIPAQTDLMNDFGPWWTGGIPRPSIPGGDSFFVYLPDRLAAVREWKAGHLPLWNAYLGGGMPMLGMQTTNPLDVLIVFHFIFSLGRALGIAYTILLFIAGFGMVLFLRGRGVQHPAALAAAGVAFALNPYFLSWLELRVFVAGLATLPLALWSLDELMLSSPKLKYAGILGLSLGYASLAGMLQTFAIVLIVIALRLLWNLITVSPSKRRPGAAILGLTLGLAIGILPLIAGLELLDHSVRLQSGRGYYAGSNFLPWRSVGLWMNNGLFGKVDTNSPYWNALHRTSESSSGWGALGIVPLFLAVFAMVRRSGSRTERIFWGGLSGLTLLFLFAMQTGVAGIVQSLWSNVNDIDLVRGVFLVNLSGAVLAGWGMEELIRIWGAGNDSRKWALLFCAYMVMGVIAVFAALHGFQASLFRALLPLILVGATAVLIGVSQTISISAKGWLFVLLITLDLCRIHFMTNPFCDATTGYPDRKIVNAIQADMGPPDYPRFFVYSHMRVFPPNIGSVFGLPDLRSYSNVPIADFRHFLEWAEDTTMENHEPLSHVDSPIYRLLGARFLFAQPSTTGRTYVREPLPNLPVGFYRRPDALPRAFLVHNVTRFPDVSAMKSALTSPYFDAAASVYLIGDVGGSITVLPNQTPDRVRIRKHDATRVVIDATSDAPGILVLSDVFYPGWQATVNGKKAPILPAYSGLRGVVVPAGSNTITMIYRPVWLWPGIIATLLAAALAIWFTVAKRFSAAAAPSSS